MLLIAGLGAAVFNLLFWITMYLTQCWEAKTERIPKKTKEFFYLESFHTSGWGDVVGLTIMDAGIAMLIIHGWNFDLFIPTILFFVSGVGSAVLFCTLCLRADHKPDAGYPAAGQISWQGKVHLVYFGFQVAYGLLGIALLLKTLIDGTFGEELPYIVTGLSGLAIYMVAFVLDIKQGHFAPASKQEAYSLE